MKLLPLLATGALVLGLAPLVASHPFTGTTTSAPGNHACTGTPDWTAQSGQSISSIGTQVNGQEVRLYVHRPPHTDPVGQDPATALPGVRMPGVIWLESNLLSGLQKNDWVCSATDGGHPDPQAHSDQVIL